MQFTFARIPAAVPYPPRFRFCRMERIEAMGDQIPSNSQEILSEDALKNYPKPLSPPLPALSQPIELSRAMSASSRSSLFSFSRSDIIFEDQWLMAVNKPAGVYCENVLSSIATLFTNSTQSETGSSSLELHLANRLDRDTSGLMLVTKSHKVAAKLVKAFTEHKVRKTYIAHCVGIAPKWEKITIKSGHGRSKYGVWRVYAASDVGKKLPGGSVVKDMETTIEVLSINGKERSIESSEERVLVVEERSVVGSDTADNSEKDEVLVRARPRSGRTHQIRLHCQYLGISILGDVKYEGVYERKGKIYQGHELHAESISFEHPITGLSVMFRAPLPSWASDQTDTSMNCIPNT
ncbi:RNA pseudouridine synthase 1 [Impatiens glandulifera]|uniref:RNA pseudouridine synthase 1 n=1 Tax=Impatiens glandulifera TaxID=253017 RepID=UPI001FB11560|nr:RNA pseudouridine synthase 1 [Impatiens glandulifera]